MLPAMPAAAPGPRHLIMQANGLFGWHGNWKVVNSFFMEEFASSEHYLVVPSRANSKRATFAGIDACGERLAAEVEEIVREHPTLEYVTFLGHSMGGLMLRFAAGRLYNPETQRVAGLQPVHFITLATPHLGCDASGESQVPFIGWLEAVPLLGRLFHAIASRVAIPVAGFMFGTSGRQFFMADGPSDGRAEAQLADIASHPLATSLSDTESDAAGEEPSGPATQNQLRLEGSASAPSAAPQSEAAAGQFDGDVAAVAPVLLLLAHDVQGRGNFYSALKAFRTRTCYANAGNDHLVGWANSSLRFLHQLPDLDLRDRAAMPVARGVVRQDPVEAGFSEHLLQQRRTLDSAAAPMSVRLEELDSFGDGGSEAAGPSLDAARCGDGAQALDRQGKELNASRVGSANGTAGRDASGVRDDQIRVGVSTPPTAPSLAEAPETREELNQRLSSQPQTGDTRGGSGQSTPSASGAGAGAGLMGSGAAFSIQVDDHMEQALEHPDLDLPAGKSPLEAVVRSSKAEKTAHILHVLQSLPWARVDCAWRDVLLKMLAHNQIQATRGWLNWEGKQACRHLATWFVQLERQMATCDPSYDVPAFVCATSDAAGTSNDALQEMLRDDEGSCLLTGAGDRSVSIQP